ncbi:MAG: AMP-binding protein, partial [Ignavibacteriota bacterium]
MIFSLLNAENNNIPDKPAIISAGGCMTYPELIDKINRSAAWLNLLGVKAGSHTAIVSGNNIDFIILL